MTGERSGKKARVTAILRTAEMRPLPPCVDSTNVSICRAVAGRSITPSELRQHLHKVWRAVRIFRPLNRHV